MILFIFSSVHFNKMLYKCHANLFLPERKCLKFSAPKPGAPHPSWAPWLKLCFGDRALKLSFRPQSDFAGKRSTWLHSDPGKNLSHSCRESSCRPHIRTQKAQVNPAFSHQSGSTQAPVRTPCSGWRLAGIPAVDASKSRPRCLDGCIWRHVPSS